MPKIICKCNEILSYSEIPCPLEYKFISDVAYDKYSDSIDSETLYHEMKSFLECPKCKRLWVFWKGYNNNPMAYIPE